MLKVSVDTKGLERLEQAISDKLARAVERTADGMVDRAQQLSPVRSGALRASLVAERLGEREWEVHDGVPYGAAVNFGRHGRPPSGFFSQAEQEAEIRLQEEAAQGVNDAIREVG